MSYSIISKQFKTSVITIDDPFVENEKIDISISKVKDVDIKVELVNNIPFIKIKIPIECSIKSASSKFNHGSTENLNVLENSINSYLENMILSFLYKTSHEYNTDLCNFKNNLSSHYLTYEELNNVNWKDIYKTSTFKVEVDSDIYHNTLFIQN